jgi:glycosyltransferase involved in cell wall biosynthesis
VVSTALGAEGLDVVSGRDLLIADQPEAFARALLSVLDDRELGARIATAARQLAVSRYAWSSAAETLETFYTEILGDRRTDARATDGRLAAGGSTA